MNIESGIFNPRSIRALFQHKRFRKGVRIYMFHGLSKNKKKSRLERNFHTVDSFLEIIKFLATKNVLGIEDLKDIQHLKSGTILTFDDGFANNLIAAEILSKFHIPWTIFITTGCLGDFKPIWTVELSLLLLYGNALHVEALDRKWPLQTTEQREYTFQSIRLLMKQMPMNQCMQTLEQIRKFFPAEETNRLLHEFPEFRMMTWVDVQQLASFGVEIGSHGVFHAIHHASQPQAVRLEEMQRSKQEIELEIGKTCRFFAFPNGDYVPESYAEAKQSGFRLSFSIEASTVTEKNIEGILPRLSASGSLSSFIEEYYWQNDQPN
jgi:peptidoglycan/xylan/chitin deacetylase (PgdA/CDA1 family)